MFSYNVCKIYLYVIYVTHMYTLSNFCIGNVLKILVQISLIVIYEPCKLMKFKGDSTTTGNILS